MSEVLISKWGLQPYRIWPLPGVLGIWGEWLFIFRDLRSTGNYFRGAGEQAHSFGDLGIPAKKQKNKGKASILFDFLKKNSASGGIAPQTPPPFLSSNSNHFRMACTCTLIGEKNMAIKFCCW